MKKIILLLMILFSICGCQNISENDIAEYCLKINQEIKNYEFNIAEAKDGKIRLYDDDLSLISEIIFSDYTPEIEIGIIKKHDNKILFAISGSFDDSNGFMIVNDDSMNNVLSEAFEGIWQIDRIENPDRNIYKYDSAP